MCAREIGRKNMMLLGRAQSRRVQHKRKWRVDAVKLICMISTHERETGSQVKQGKKKLNKNAIHSKPINKQEP